jgi:hypothetical protein
LAGELQYFVEQLLVAQFWQNEAKIINVFKTRLVCGGDARRQLECSAVILAADQVRAGHQSQNREGARPQIPDKLLALADEVIE